VEAPAAEAACGDLVVLAVPAECEVLAALVEECPVDPAEFVDREDPAVLAECVAPAALAVPVALEWMFRLRETSIR
jgi:hypothetical protein